MGPKNEFSWTQMSSGTSSKEKIYFNRLLITCLSFLLAAGISSASTTESTSTEAVTESYLPDYNDINITVDYESDPEYDPDGLDWLYSITKSFLNSILEEAFPDNIITINRENEVDVNFEGHVSDILAQYAYVVALCAIIVLFAVGMLLAGFCFSCWCCCCCGCCADGSAANNEKKDTKKKVCLSSLLIVFGALITFGAVCALCANQRLQDGVQNFPEDMRKSIRDVKLFLNTTVDEINILLGDNLDTFTGRVNDNLNDCSKSVQNEVDEIIEQMKLYEIFETVDIFTNFKWNVEVISSFITTATSVTTDLKKVYDKVTEHTAFCGSDCADLLSNIKKLDITVPDSISETFSSALKSISNIPDSINIAKTKFNEINDAIPTTIQNSMETAQSGITEADNTIKEEVEKISSVVKDLEGYLPNTNSNIDGQDSFLDTVQQYVDKYDIYRQYVGVAICCIIFSIVGLLAIGITCGFGRNNFFNRGGNLFLLCGTTLMFYLTIFIAAITLIYFLVGLTAQQAVCNPLRNPSDSRFFDLVDQFNLSDYGLDTTPSKMLSSIREDQSAYNVFNLKSQFDVDDVNDYLDDFKSALNDVDQLSKNINFDDFKDMVSTVIKTVQDISAPDFTSFQTLLETLTKNLETSNINEITAELTLTIEKYTYSYATDVKELQSALFILNKRQTDIAYLVESVSSVETAKSSLQTDLTNFEDRKDNLINILNNVPILTNNLPELITNIVKDYGNKTLEVCQNYLNRVIDETKNSIGKCGPLGNVLDATLTSVCDKVGLQVNSFWFVLLWTMLIFLPTVVISVKLANFYRSKVSRKPIHVETFRLPVIDTKRNKLERIHDYTESPTISNADPFIVPRNATDIPLNKWEQYPPPKQPQYTLPEELTRPPPYFEDTTDFRIFDRPQQRNRNTHDDLSKWTQYPVGNSSGNPTEQRNRRFM